MILSIELPTHKELATLAASIPLNIPAGDKVREAIAIWEAAFKALEERKRIKAQVQASEEKTERIMGGREFRDGMSRDEFLAVLMPTMKTLGDRLARYRQFLHHALRVWKYQDSDRTVNLEDLPETPSSEVEALIEKERQSTMPQWFALNIAIQFLKWNEAHTTKARSSKAAAAAKSRHSKKKPLEPKAAAKRNRKQSPPSRKQKSDSREQR